MRILLLEDDAGICTLLTMALKEFEHEVIAVESAENALAWLEVQSADLMVVDYSLPDMSGKAFIEALRRRKSPAPDFIVITGREDVRLAVDMMKLGARDYLVKDLHLLEMVPEVIRRVEQELENEQKLKRAEQVVRENEKIFKMLFEEALNPILVADQEGRYIDANKAALEFLECERGELLGGKYVWNFSPSSFLDRQKREHAPFVSRHMLEAEYWVRGKIKTLLLNVVPLERQGQKILYGIGQDITDRKKAEDALRESEERFRRVYEHMAVGVARVSMDFRIETANEAYCRMLGYREEELIGKHLKNITHPEMFEENLRKQSQLGRGEIEHYRMEKCFIHKDGHPVYGILDANLVRNAEGKPLYFLGSVLDISERKRAEESVRAALEEKEVLLRELYHRTKNNMQVISSMLALQARYIDNQEVLHIFEDMENRIQSMALVHQKLYQSKNLSRINLGEYINDLAALLFRSYSSSQKIVFEIEAEDVFVLIDLAMPCSLIVNELITNALKYAFPGNRDGRIRITLRRLETKKIDLWISDNGVGVPENFDFRTTSSLGLQTVFGLAERQLHGKIQFHVNDGLMCHLTFRDDLYKERI